MDDLEEYNWTFIPDPSDWEAKIDWPDFYAGKWDVVPVTWDIPDLEGWEQIPDVSDWEEKIDWPDFTGWKQLTI